MATQTTIVFMAIALCAIVISAGSLVYSMNTLNSLADRLTTAEDTLDRYSAYISEQEELAARIEAAKKEGALTIYCSLSAKTVEPLVAAFMEEYPFIEVTYMRLDSFMLGSRYESEVTAGIYAADIYGPTSQWMIMKDFTEKGYFTAYNSSQYQYYPDDLKNPPYWCTAVGYYGVFAWNTLYVSAEEAPKTWEEVLNPAWKGKIGLTVPWATSLTWNMMYMLRTDPKYGRDWFVQLAALEPVLFTSVGASRTALETGEIWVNTHMGTHEVKAAVDAGAPVTTIFPANENITLSENLIAIGKNPPHPNAARVFIDWVLSYEGQQVFVDNGRNSYMINGPTSDMIEQWMEGDTIHYFKQPYEKHAEVYDDWIADLKQLLGVPT